MKKAVSLVLVFSILLLSGNLFAQGRKGADLIIQKKDGTQVRGELIAVKENSILLMERDSGADVTVDIGNIKMIPIVKKPKLWLGAGLGLLAGAAAGALSYGSYYYFVQGFYFGAIGAGIGLFLGFFVGAAVRIDKKIQFEGKSDSEIQEILEKLRKKARVRNVQ